MPRYEYECRCGATFERIASIEDRHDVECPECGAPAEHITLLISSTSPPRNLSTPGPGQYDKGSDPSFKKEWDELWSDDPVYQMDKAHKGKE